MREKNTTPVPVELCHGSTHKGQVQFLIYKDIYKLGGLIYDKLTLTSPTYHHNESLPRMPKTPVNCKKNICKLIMDNRQDYGRSDTISNAFPAIHAFVQDLPFNEDLTIHVLEQRNLLERIYSLWGVIRKPTESDRVRTFGILLHEEFSDHLRFIVDQRYGDLV